MLLVFRADRVQQVIDTLSALLGVDGGKLRAMLLTRVVRTMREQFVVQLKVRDAAYTRDSIVKSLYEVRHEGYYFGPCIENSFDFFCRLFHDPTLFDWRFYVCMGMLH